MSVPYINCLNVGYKTGQPRGIAPTDLYQTFFKRYNANGLRPKTFTIGYSDRDSTQLFDRVSQSFASR